MESVKTEKQWSLATLTLADDRFSLGKISLSFTFQGAEMLRRH